MDDRIEAMTFAMVAAYLAGVRSEAAPYDGSLAVSLEHALEDLGRTWVDDEVEIDPTVIAVFRPLAARAVGLVQSEAHAKLGQWAAVASATLDERLRPAVVLLHQHVADVAYAKGYRNAMDDALRVVGQGALDDLPPPGQPDEHGEHDHYVCTAPICNCLVARGGDDTYSCECTPADRAVLATTCLECGWIMQPIDPEGEDGGAS